MQDISAEDLVNTLREGLLVLDENLFVASANRSFLTMFGVDPEQTLGRRVYDLGDGQWDIPELRHLLEEILPRETTVEGYEVDHVFPVVGRRVVHLNARKVLRPGNGVGFLLVTFCDVTDARLAQLEATRAALLVRSMVDTVRDPLVILDGDMRITMASRNFVRLFNAEETDLVGKRISELGQGQWNVTALRTVLDRVVPDERPFEDFLIEDDFPGLGHRVFKLNARKVYVTGSHDTSLLLAFEDVTDATSAERLKDVLAAELAHRIKNSLAVISAFVSFEIRRAAEPCAVGYRAMQARINAVAQLYDVIARSSSFGPVAIQAYLDGIGSSIQSGLLGRGSEIAMAVETEALVIGADHAVPIGLLVNELVTNAVKYAFPGGRGRIKLGFGRRDGDVVLTVEDDGIGLDAAAQRSSESSGLGSRFIDAFVRQLGGTLARAGGPGGTTITVRLPNSILA